MARQPYTLMAAISFAHIQEEKLNIDTQGPRLVHALAVYANPQRMKIDGFLKHQPITILTDIRSTNNFMDSKVATQLTLWVEDRS
ncbi:hypothetical protein B296_00045959, partial [Ensete ventricosum]